MEEKKYLYADRQEQIKKVHQMMIVSYSLFYTFSLMIIWVATLRGIRTVGYAGANTAVVAVFIGVMAFLFQKNHGDAKIKYVALAGVLCVLFLMAMAFDNYYVRFLAVLPFITGILFFDRKYSSPGGSQYHNDTDQGFRNPGLCGRGYDGSGLRHMCYLCRDDLYLHSNQSCYTVQSRYASQPDAAAGEAEGDYG